MAYQDQNQKPMQSQPKPALSAEEVELIAKITRREGWKEFTTDDIAMCWDQFPDGSTSTILAPHVILADFKRFVRMASSKKIDPLNNHCHFEYRNDRNSTTGVKGTAVVHQDGLLVIAASSGLLDGIEQTHGKDERGFWVETSVHRKDCSKPFIFRAYHKEFVQTKSDGTPNHIWARMEYNMTAKCSRAGCLRIAFPEQTGGMMDEAEVGDYVWQAPEPTAAPTPAIKIGEKLTPVPAPEAPAPIPAPVLVQPTKEPTITPTPAVKQALAEVKEVSKEDYAAQYKARLATLTGKDSAYVKLGLTKGHVDQFLMGWFGAESKAKLSTFPPEDFPGVLDTLIVALAADSEAIKTLIEDPISYGFSMRPAPTPEKDLALELRLKEIQSFFQWETSLVLVAEKVLAKEGIPVDRLGFFKEALDKQMPNFSETQLEIALAVGYYDPDAMAALLKCHFAKKMPLTWFLAQINAKVGGDDILALSADPAKVALAVDEAIKSLDKK